MPKHPPLIPVLVWYYARMVKGLPGYHGVYGVGKPVFVAKWGRDKYVIFQGGTNVGHFLARWDEAWKWVHTLRDGNDHPIRVENSGTLNVSLSRSIGKKSRRLK